MSAKRTRHGKGRDAPLRGRADLKRLRRMSEAAIQASSPPELADLPEEFWDDAILVLPEPKQAVSLRLDRDLLEWFRAAGPGYQTRMNAVLRSYMDSLRGSRTRDSRATGASRVRKRG